MRRFETTFKTLATLRAMTRGATTKEIKKSIGDSTNNNRTLTVSQLVRYLNRVNCVNIAKQVEVVTGILEKDILRSRSNRTDAIDIGELVTTYRKVVMNKRRLRREIGTAVSRQRVG